MFKKYSWLFAVMVLALVLSIAGINKTPLQGSTEPREAGVAAEMLQDGDYLVPRLNGTLFLEKPPLSYWLQSASIDVFGYQYWAPRLPSLLAGFACALLMYFYLTAMCASTAIGALAAGLLLTMASFWLNSRTAGQDILLTCGVALALFGFYFSRESQRAWLQWLLYGVGLAIATMTKGLIGLAIPGAAIFTFLLAETLLLRRIELRAWLAPGVLALPALIPFALWLYQLQQHIGADAVREIIWSNSVSRFAGDYAHGSHAEPFHYYFKKLFEIFQPWTLLLVVAIWQLSKHLKLELQQRLPSAQRVLFFVCWLGGPFLLLSLSAGKRPTYLLMLYPAAAALIAIFSDRLLTRAEDISQRVVQQRLRMIYAVILASIGLFVATRLFKVHIAVAAIALLTATAVLTFSLWRAAQQNRWRTAGMAGLGLMACVYIAFGCFVLPHGARGDAVTPLFQRALALHATGAEIALYRPMERVAGAARFYLHQQVTELDSPEQVDRLWQANPSAVVIVDADNLNLFGSHRVIDRFVSRKRGFALIGK